MASIAALPVLIGLAVDYAIQFQARFDEARARAATREPAVRAPRVAGGPTILTAGLATAVGLPRAAAVAGADGARLRRAAGARHRARARRARSAPASPRSCASAAARRAPAAARPRARGSRRCASHPRVHAAGEWLADRAWRALGVRARRGRGACWRSGWRWPSSGSALDTQSEVVSDVRELVPQDLQALQDVNVLQEETGVSGEIDVTVRADDITDPEVIAWMTQLPGAACCTTHGYRPGQALHPEAEPARAVPGAVAARPVHARRAARRRCGTPARRGAGLLLAGRGHRRPHDRQPRVRHPADAARPPEGGGGRHQGRARTARRA